MKIPLDMRLQTLTCFSCFSYKIKSSIFPLRLFLLNVNKCCHRGFILVFIRTYLQCKIPLRTG